MSKILTVRVTQDEYKSLTQLMTHLHRRTISDVIHYLIEDATEKTLSKSYTLEHKPSPSSSRRASPSSRPRVARAAKAEAPKASPAPASRYPAGLEEGVKALCREVWKKDGSFQLDGQRCELYSTAVGWLLEHAAETMERRNLDVEGYLAFRRSQMLAGGEAGL